MPDPCSMGSSSGRSLNQTSQDTPGPVSVSACKLAGERGAELADHAVDGGGGDTQVLAGHGNGHQGPGQEHPGKLRQPGVASARLAMASQLLLGNR